MIKFYHILLMRDAKYTLDRVFSRQSCNLDDH